LLIACVLSTGLCAIMPFWAGRSSAWLFAVSAVSSLTLAFVLLVWLRRPGFEADNHGREGQIEKGGPFTVLSYAGIPITFYGALVALVNLRSGSTFGDVWKQILSGVCIFAVGFVVMHLHRLDHRARDK